MVEKTRAVRFLGSISQTSVTPASNRFLHQGAVNQLAQTVLSYLGLDDILLRRGAGRGVEPDSLQRDPTQPAPQVGQGLDFGSSDRRLRHNGFPVVPDTSMPLAAILTPPGFLGKTVQDPYFPGPTRA
jgi:hypothetical protein